MLRCYPNSFHMYCFNSAHKLAVRALFVQGQTLDVAKPDLRNWHLRYTYIYVLCLWIEPQQLPSGSSCQISLGTIIGRRKDRKREWNKGKGKAKTKGESDLCIQWAKSWWVNARKDLVAGYPITTYILYRGRHSTQLWKFTCESGR